MEKCAEDEEKYWPITTEEKYYFSKGKGVT
jgi:hypothetical protein